MSKYKVEQVVYVAENDRFGVIEDVWEHNYQSLYKIEGCISKFGGFYFSEEDIHPLTTNQRLLRIEKALGLDVDNDEEIG